MGTISRSVLLLSLGYFCSASWAESSIPVEWSGDLRLRARWEKDGDAQAQSRQQIRARFGFSSKLNEEVAAMVRMATGDGNRSANLTLGDTAEPAGARRTFGIDQALVRYKPNSHLKLDAGRVPQNHYRPGDSQVLLDDDISLDGATLSAQFSNEDWLNLFANLGSSTLRHNPSGEGDNVLNWAQIVSRLNFDTFTVNLGGGFFNFDGTRGRDFTDFGGSANGNGNTVATTPGQIANNYLPVQYFVDFKIPLGDLSINPFFEYVQNRNTEESDRALWTGTTVVVGSVDMLFAYLDLESDAVFAPMTNSNFGGGNTDSSGYLAQARWNVSEKLNWRITGFLNRKDVTGADTEYNRVHVDLSLKF